MGRGRCEVAMAVASVGAILLSATAPLRAETRAYSYNARGELVGESVSGGPANGVQTSIGYDAAGNRTSYRTSGSSAAIRFPIPIVVPLGGLKVVIIPE